MAARNERMCTSVAPASRRSFTMCAAGGAAHDGIVHEHHALALHRGRHGIELDAHEVLAIRLRRLNERAADILVFDKAQTIGNAALARVANGRVNARIRHADDHIRLYGMLQRQKLRRALPRHVHRGYRRLRNPAARSRCIRNTQDVLGAFPQCSRKERTPFLSATTISPGSMSRSNEAPMLSSAQLSLANTTEPSGS